ncbi:hypothetical protein YC2023_018436 [Brassica napus]
MSMEPSLLLLALYSGAELRRGGETSDGAATSNHLATVTDLLDHQLSTETFVPWTLLERAGVQRKTVLATLRIIYPYEKMLGWEFYLLNSVICVFSIAYLTE